MPKHHSWLSIAEVARLLQIPVVKVQRWVHQGKIPCKFNKQGVMFRRGELLDWARSHDLRVSPSTRDACCHAMADDRLYRAIQAGGVEFNLEGEDIYSVLQAVARRLRFDPPLAEEKILDELLSREELASTGVGRGVAIPHPRHMGALAVECARISLCFLAQPVDFAAVDGRPVDLLFVMFSPDSRSHLGLLSRLGYLLRREDFPQRLRGCRSGAEVKAIVQALEREIRSDGGGSR